MSRPKQRLLPFFLPMLGCPHRCVFCDQRAISGKASAPTPEEVRRALDGFPPDMEAELAYYGGSFTCLPRPQQEAWLSLAAPYIEGGVIGGVRVSTRPDAVDDDICAFLREHGVTTVELGVQSFDDGVLRQSGRGCTGESAIAACAAVRRAGIRLGVQLMTGLPGDRPELALSSMEQALECGAELLRIYPTLVIEGTELARLYAAGKYAPQSLTEAVSLCADMLELAEATDVPVQRLGLNPGPELERSLIAGPYHPAFGGLVREEVCFRKAAALLEAAGAAEKPCRLLCAGNDLARLVGQKRAGLERLTARFPGVTVAVDPALEPGQMRAEAAD